MIDMRLRYTEQQRLAREHYLRLLDAEQFAYMERVAPILERLAQIDAGAIPVFIVSNPTSSDEVHHAVLAFRETPSPA